MSNGEHGQIMRSLGRIEGKVDGLRASVERQRQDHEQLEGRTRSLENWRWYIIGLFSLSVISGLVGFVFFR